MNYIEDLEFTIGGVNHPKVDIRGKKKNDFELKLFVDDKEVKLINNNNENFVFSSIKKTKITFFNYSAVIDKKAKKIKLYVVINDKQIEIDTIKTSVFKRFVNRFKYSFVKLKRFVKVLFKAIKIAWTKYHFLIPPRAFKVYLSSFKNNLKTNHISGREPTYYYNPLIKEDYNRWLKENNKKTNYVDLKYKPLISIIIPVYNINKEYLSACLDSVLSQTYTNFEICIADDCSSNKETIKTLKEYEKKDNRVKVIYRKENGHISKASNSAIGLATGEFIGLLDNDDLLDKDALYEVALALNNNTKLDMLYSDEDKIDLYGIRCEPNFKPDYSPDTFYSINYICHFTVIRKSIVDKVGGFRSEYDGSQDYDLFLRVTEETSNIYHIPKILYHWRMIEGSTSANGANKNYAYDAGKRALEDALKRRNIKATINQINNPQMYYINYIFDKEPSISIIIPTKDKPKVLNTCLKSIYKKTNYSNFEIIVVDNGSIEKKTFKLLDKYKKKHPNFKVLTLDCPFNYSYLNNEAAKKANGEYILFLNNDTEVIYGDFLKDMVGYAMQKHIGCVGAKLLYPNDTIQHCGVTLFLGGVAGHAFSQYPKNSFGYFGRLASVCDWGAVTAACLMIKKDKFVELGYFDETLKVAFNDVDLNMKALEKGYYNVVLPKVQLYHYESLSRGSDLTPDKIERFKGEINYIHNKWNNKITYDKFYNPNFSYKYSYLLDKENQE